MEKITKIVLYEDLQGYAPMLDVMLHQDTIWLTQSQLASLFTIDRYVVTKHFGNIFRTGELSEESSVQMMHIANSDKPVKFYNLDACISVGYRTNSKAATRFRIWATQVLKNHILRGFTINQKRLKEET